MWATLQELFAELWRDESCHTFMEYALCASLISMAILGAIQLLAAKVGGTFETLAHDLP
jgi:Flp pilus assembly pilin Flp